MSQTCSRCGEPVANGMNVCANCGAAVSRPGAKTRCRHCYRRSPSDLTICPHCGRELQQWRPIRGIVTALVIFILATWLLLGNGFSTLSNAASKAVALLPPPATSVPPPASINLQATIEVAEAPTDTPTVVVIEPTATSVEQPPTPTTEPLEAILLDPTAMPTATIAAEATADEPVYTVKSGDTLSGIASTLGVSLESLMIYNNITNPGALQVGQKIRIPQPTATPEPTATTTPTPEPVPTDTNTPEPSASPTARVRTTATPTSLPSPTIPPTPLPTATNVAPDVYVVKPGDTLLGIAAQVGRSADAIAKFNNILDPTALRVNQQLRIPPADYTPPPPTATPTPRPRATATPTATPTIAIRVAAPVLVSPADNGAYSGGEAIIYLNWQNPDGLPAGVENVVNVGVLVGPDQIDWRFSEPVGQGTDYKVPVWLHGQAPQEFGRVYVWFVQAALVNRDGGQPTIIATVSPPSAQRRFNWN
ncbi:MAG: LysM peptidoglycan-binding domain-containing protein [Caldilineales bacterium]|nr:LysM peptidoglycan-binding domain-containing protein [Caldilineales bacterium]